MLHLLGTVHTDIYLPRRVHHFLSHTQPDIITLETTTENYKYSLTSKDAVQRNAEEFLRVTDDPRIANLITVGYAEDWVVDHYANNHDVTVHCIDGAPAELVPSEELVRAGTEHAENTLQGGTLTEKINAWIASTENDYRVAATEPLPEELEAFYAERDEYMANKISELYTDGMTLSHIGGIDHLIAPYHNLADRLGEYHPIIHIANAIDIE